MRSLTIRNCNVSLGNMKSLETPMGMLLQIEVLVIFAALLLLFLVIFGSCRRRCNNDPLRLVIFAAYTCSTYILTYTIGLMQDAPFHNELFPIWAMFLTLVLGSADSISAYSLEDHEQWRRYKWLIRLKLVWVMVLIALYFRRSKSSTTTAVVCLALTLLHKSNERAWALMAPSRKSLERSTKVVADYMKSEHQSRGNSSDVVDPVPMTGCTYLVLGEEEHLLTYAFEYIHLLTYAFEYIAAMLRVLTSPRGQGMEKAQRAPHYRMELKKDQLVTIEKVWKCEGWLLSSAGGDPDNKLKDKCLSFALFKLLRLRYAGYSLPQEAHKNTWNLICRGLLSQDDGYKRAFQVVEAELSFLFDFFYTKYSAIFRPGLLDNRMLALVIFAIGIWATTLFLKHYERPNSDCRLATLPNGLSVDVLVTTAMIILFIIMELVQFLFMAFSEWAKVIWICEYVQRKSWQDSLGIGRMIRAICRFKLQKPWERMLHQYSLLESYSHKRSRFYNEVIAADMHQTRDGQKQSTSIKLPKQVKQAVFDALKSLPPHDWPIQLEIGKASLRKDHKCKELLWACKFETVTQVVMVWHIATSFCEHQLPPKGSESPAMSKSFLVGTSLSKYLAYLVAFAPQLLPDHPYDAEHVFDQVIIEFRIFFSKCSKMDDRIRAIKSDSRGECLSEQSVLKRGARLGNQLVNDIADNEKIWKILANFWVEMMLYVAPSNDARAHAEHLARGGEFVTHLWALLSHAGIERAPPSV